MNETLVAWAMNQGPGTAIGLYLVWWITKRLGHDLKEIKQGIANINDHSDKSLKLHQEQIQVIKENGNNKKGL
jgi:hypothetical protein